MSAVAGRIPLAAPVLRPPPPLQAKSTSPVPPARCSIPPAWLHSLPASLKELHLNANNITGSLPGEEWAPPAGLDVISLFANQIEGALRHAAHMLASPRQCSWGWSAAAMLPCKSSYSFFHSCCSAGRRCSAPPCPMRAVAHRVAAFMAQLPGHTRVHQTRQH